MPMLFSPSRLLLAEVVAGLGHFPDRGHILGTLPESRTGGALLPPAARNERATLESVQLTSAAAPMIER
jgi:hypothetical protein